MSLPTLGSVSVAADLTVQVPVASLGGNATVRVDYAVAATVPTSGSRLWLVVDTLGSPDTVATSVQLRGTTVWVRASGRSATGVQTSAYTTPVQVSIGDVARFASAAFSLVGRVPSITWAASALASGVRILWDVHAPGTDPGTLSSTADVEADYGAYTLSESLADGQAITIQLQAWSGWNSGTAQVDGTEGESVRATLVQLAPAVAAHAHTHEAGGTDELDAGNLVLTAPDASRWRLTVSNSGELAAEIISA